MSRRMRGKFFRGKGSRANLVYFAHRCFLDILCIQDKILGSRHSGNRHTLPAEEGSEIPHKDGTDRLPKWMWRQVRMAEGTLISEEQEDS